MKTGPRAIGIVAALLVVYVFWGSGWVALKLALETLPPFLMLALRWSLAGAVLFVWGLLRVPRAERDVNSRTVRATFYLGVSIIGLANTGYIYSIQFLPSGITAILASAMPVFTAVAAFAMTRKPLGLPAILGLVVAICGIAFLAWPSGTVSLPLVPVGIMMLANVIWAIAAARSPALELPRHVTISGGLQLLFGSLVPTVLALATGEIRGIASLTVQSSLWVLWLAILAGVLPFAAYTWLLKNARPTISSTFAYVNPIVALALGAIVLHEPVTGHVIVGSLVVVAGVVAIVYHKHVLPESHPLKTSLAPVVHRNS